MKIAIDIDDTIANTHQEIIKLALEYDQKYLNGTGIKNKEATYIVEMFAWRHYEAENFLKFLRNKNYYKDIAPIKDANKYIELLYDEGHEIIFITRRSNNERIRNITKKWLKKHNFKYHHLILGTPNKGEVCHNLNMDFLIDNDPNNIYDAIDYGIDGIVITDTYNKDENEITRLDTWKEIYNYVRGKCNGKNC